MGASFGQEILVDMSWAKRQKKLIMKVFQTFGDDRFTDYSDVYSEDADDVDRIPELDRKLRFFGAYVPTFTSADAHRVVRNSSDSQGLEAWRRLRNEYDPTKSMKRVTLLGYVQNPTTCDRIEDLGIALEDCLAKKPQYE